MEYDFETFTRQALSEPGKIHEAYSRLHEFSLPNQLLAMSQMSRIEPIASYNKWKELGRQVQRGAKGIALMMPVFQKAKSEVTKAREAEQDRGPPIFFQMRRYWFPLSATSGQQYSPPPIPDFDIKKATASLNITEEPFQAISGNCMGYAKTDQRIIAINPLAYDHFKTEAHEDFHCILHLNTISIDGDLLEKAPKEVEAELGAYLVCAALGKTDNLVYSRGYIQSYLDDTSMEKIRLPKVYAAADAILKAGRPTSPSPAVSVHAP